MEILKEKNNFKVAVLTISDSVSKGEKKDTSGPALVDILTNEGFDVIYTSVSSDDKDDIKKNILKCVDELKVDFVVTTGGTGFAIRDNTPEVTKELIEKEVPGIPEVMRAESMTITDKACLSRAVCGIRKRSLILNLPGSEKSAKENLMAVLNPIKHGIEMLKGEGSAMCGEQKAVIKAVCISEKKGVQKHEVASISMKVDWGIEGDAHAANWHRQISLLSVKSVEKLQSKLSFDLKPGAFAENILIEDGICLYELPVGTKLKIGTALCEVTQIGKECHETCEIRKIAGDCVMPREGIFVKVLEAGVAKKGDIVERIR